MVETIINGERTNATHVGTSGMTITATRTDDQVDVQMEFEVPSEEECQAMIATLLTQLEELHGEAFVAQCISHYAADTGKIFLDQGDHKLVMIRGNQKRGKKA